MDEEKRIIDDNEHDNEKDEKEQIITIAREILYGHISAFMELAK